MKKKKNYSDILEYIKMKTKPLNFPNQLEDSKEDSEISTPTANFITIKSILDNSLDNWICGFITGEGCFNITQKNVLVFYIEQSEKKVLNIIKNRFNLSTSIHFREKRFEDYKNTYSLSASSKKDINTLISLILRKKVLKIWKETNLFNIIFE